MEFKKVIIAKKSTADEEKKSEPGGGLLSICATAEKPAVEGFTIEKKRAQAFSKASSLCSSLKNSLNECSFAPCCTSNQGCTSEADAEQGFPF